MTSSGSAGRRYRVQSRRGNPFLHAPRSSLLHLYGELPALSDTQTV